MASIRVGVGGELDRQMFFDSGTFHEVWLVCEVFQPVELEKDT